jgi:opacity protein-like surface antigen
MKKLTIAIAAVALGVAGAQAADLIVDEPAVVADPVVTGFYAQLVGGAALPGVIDYSSSGEYDMDAGWGIGGTLGVTVMDGLSVELDVLHLSRTMSLYDYYDVATTSVMGNLKYTVDLNDTFSIYGAAGLGYIFVTETDDSNDATYHGGGFGYQLIAGVGAKVAENITVIGEYRFQNTFNGSEQDYGQTVDTPTSAVLVGAKLAF